MLNDNLKSAYVMLIVKSYFSFHINKPYNDISLSRIAWPCCQYSPSSNHYLCWSVN